MKKPQINPSPEDLAREGEALRQQTSPSDSPQKPDKDLAAADRGDGRPPRRRITPTLVQRIDKRSATPKDANHKDPLPTPGQITSDFGLLFPHNLLSYLTNLTDGFLAPSPFFSTTFFLKIQKKPLTHKIRYSEFKKNR